MVDVVPVDAEPAADVVVEGNTDLDEERTIMLSPVIR